MKLLNVTQTLIVLQWTYRFSKSFKITCCRIEIFIITADRTLLLCLLVLVMAALIWKHVVDSTPTCPRSNSGNLVLSNPMS